VVQEGVEGVELELGAGLVPKGVGCSSCCQLAVSADDDRSCRGRRRRWRSYGTSTPGRISRRWNGGRKCGGTAEAEGLAVIARGDGRGEAGLDGGLSGEGEADVVIGGEKEVSVAWPRSCGIGGADDVVNIGVRPEVTMPDAVIEGLVMGMRVSAGRRGWDLPCPWRAGCRRRNWPADDHLAAEASRVLRKAGSAGVWVGKFMSSMMTFAPEAVRRSMAMA